MQSHTVTVNSNLDSIEIKSPRHRLYCPKHGEFESESQYGILILSLRGRRANICVDCFIDFIARHCCEVENRGVITGN